MQVVFSIEEFRLLVHVLREYSESDSQPYTSLQKSATDLLEKILARDFGFSIDELEDLELILQGKEKTVRESLKSENAPSPEVRHEEEVLEHVLDRVTEACAMG